MKSATPSNPLRLRGVATNLTRQDELDTARDHNPNTPRHKSLLQGKPTANPEQDQTRFLSRPQRNSKRSGRSPRSTDRKIQPHQSSGDEPYEGCSKTHTPPDSKNPEENFSGQRFLSKPEKPKRRGRSRLCRETRIEGEHGDRQEKQSRRRREKRLRRPPKGTRRSPGMKKTPRQRTLVREKGEDKRSSGNEVIDKRSSGNVESVNIAYVNMIENEVIDS